MHLPPDDGGLVGDDGDEGGDGRDEGGDGNGRVGVREGELVAAPRGGEGGEGMGGRGEMPMSHLGLSTRFSLEAPLRLFMASPSNPHFD